MTNRRAELLTARNEAEARLITASRMDCLTHDICMAYLNASDEVQQKIKAALHQAAETACGNVPELPVRRARCLVNLCTRACTSRCWSPSP